MPLPTDLLASTVDSQLWTRLNLPLTLPSYKFSAQTEQKTLLLIVSFGYHLDHKENTKSIHCLEGYYLAMAHV
jgi:hypothetical protein